MRLLRRRSEIITRPGELGPPRAARRGTPGRYAGRMLSRALIVAGLVLAAVALPSAATGATKKKKKVVTVQASRHLWATVNVCDPAMPAPGLPDTIGVRASMPGSRDGREVMFMRFRVQFQSAADKKWHNVIQGGDSGWMPVGLARYKARQSGRNFRVPPPAGEPTLLLRAKVNFEWRLKGEVVRKAVALTTKGHKSSAGSVPDGYSEATCTITA